MVRLSIITIDSLSEPIARKYEYIGVIFMEKQIFGVRNLMEYRGVVEGINKSLRIANVEIKSIYENEDFFVENQDKTFRICSLRATLTNYNGCLIALPVIGVDARGDEFVAKVVNISDQTVEAVYATGEEELIRAIENFTKVKEVENNNESLEDIRECYGLYNEELYPNWLLAILDENEVFQDREEQKEQQLVTVCVEGMVEHYELKEGDKEKIVELCELINTMIEEMIDMGVTVRCAELMAMELIERTRVIGIDQVDRLLSNGQYFFGDFEELCRSMNFDLPDFIIDKIDNDVLYDHYCDYNSVWYFEMDDSVRFLLDADL